MSKTNPNHDNNPKEANNNFSSVQWSSSDGGTFFIGREQYREIQYQVLSTEQNDTKLAGKESEV